MPSGNTSRRFAGMIRRSAPLPQNNRDDDLSSCSILTRLFCGRGRDLSRVRVPYSPLTYSPLTLFLLLPSHLTTIRVTIGNTPSKQNALSTSSTGNPLTPSFVSFSRLGTVEPAYA